MRLGIVFLLLRVHRRRFMLNERVDKTTNLLSKSLFSLLYASTEYNEFSIREFRQKLV